MDKKKFFSLFFGVTVSAVALYFSLKGVPLAELTGYVSGIEFFWIFPALAVAMGSMFIRNYRWMMILGRKWDIGFWHAWHPMIIGFMLNCILPRAGELARPAILRKRSGVPFSTGLATVAVERIFDLIILTLLMAFFFDKWSIGDAKSVQFAGYQLNSDILKSLADGMVRLGITAAAGMVLMMVTPFREWLKRVITGLPAGLFFFLGDRKAHFKEKMTRSLVSLIDNIGLGFSQMRSARAIAFCLALSAAVWLSLAASYWIMSWGCPGIRLSFSQMTAVLVIICFAIALPSVPGFWGIWEAGGVFALSLFGIPLMESAGFTLVNHVVQLVPAILLGVVSVIITGIRIGESVNQPEREHPEAGI